MDEYKEQSEVKAAPERNKTLNGSHFYRGENLWKRRSPSSFENTEETSVITFITSIQLFYFRNFSAIATKLALPIQNTSSSTSNFGL